MRVVITGATGNAGTSLVEALVDEPAVTEIVGIARRRPEGWSPPKTTWVQADISRDDLVPHFRGADAVVHLAWLLQPSRDEAVTNRVNIGGSGRVFDAVGAAGVPALVYASSVAAYSHADPATPVDESWQTGGIPSAYYSRQKVAVEELLAAFERAHPDVRVAFSRPALIFKRESASQQRRFFMGPLMPGRLARRSLIPFVPRMENLAGQVIHTSDIADGYRRLIVNPEARGPYNFAGEPPLDSHALSQLLGAREVPVPASLTRALVGLSWRARLQPVSPDWLDIGLGVPVMNTAKAKTELGWSPQVPAGDVLLELMEGLRTAAGFPTPPLEPHAGGRLRIKEFLTGVGARSSTDVPD